MTYLSSSTFWGSESLTEAAIQRVLEHMPFTELAYDRPATHPPC